MSWDRMSIDEFAIFRRNGGDRVVNVKGTWWVEARPFFYRPLFPFSRVAPAPENYPSGSLIGGVVHLVPEGSRGNSWMNLFLYGDLQDYALERLGKMGWTARKGLQQLRAGRIHELERFVEEAYPVYRSFYQRTRYFYKRERTLKTAFHDWASSIFSTPKVVVTGAYLQERLCAIDIAYQVEDVIIDDVFFSDTASQQLQVTDFMLHILREAARESDARWLFRGYPSGKESLDRSKLMRGCKLVPFPGQLRLNPFITCLGKAAMGESYRKLLAMTTPPDGEGRPAGKPHARS